MTRVFEDRRAAGRLLAELLSFYAAKPGVIVLGLPRGGVPVTPRGSWPRSPLRPRTQ